MPRRFVPGHIPDPAKAHGAWVYLAASVMAGALAAVGRGFVPALLAGVGFAGVFLAASAVAIGVRRGWRRLTLGIAIAGIAGTAALRTVSAGFAIFGIVAVLSAGVAAYIAQRAGYRAAPALGFAVAAIAVAAPSSACAGGVHAADAAVLLGLLAPFYCWRTVRVRRALSEGRWTRTRLRATGLREAVLAVAWTTLAVAVVHAIAM